MQFDVALDLFRRIFVIFAFLHKGCLNVASVSDNLRVECVAEKEWDVIDGAICFLSSSAATHEQPGTSGAVCRDREKKRRGEHRGRQSGRFFYVSQP